MEKILSIDKINILLRDFFTKKANNVKQIIFVLFAVIALYCNANAQQPFPQGLYMSLDEIRQHQPSVTTSLDVVKRSSFDIKMNGGNDYKIESSDKSWKKNIKKKAWAYSDGDTLYINCRMVKAQPWYAKVLEPGKYLIFDAAYAKHTQEYRNDVAKSATVGYMFGLLGGFIYAASSTPGRLHYALDVKTGLLYVINLDFIFGRLSTEEDDVFYEFQKDLKAFETIQNDEQREKTVELLVTKYTPYINR